MGKLGVIAELLCVEAVRLFPKNFSRGTLKSIISRRERDKLRRARERERAH